MYKMIVHVTQSFDTEAEALKFYEIVKYSLKDFKDVHVNGQVVKKFTGYSPENPEGHEVTA